MSHLSPPIRQTNCVSFWPKTFAFLCVCSTISEVAMRSKSPLDLTLITLKASAKNPTRCCVLTVSHACVVVLRTLLLFLNWIHTFFFFHYRKDSPDVLLFFLLFVFTFSFVYPLWKWWLDGQFNGTLNSHREVDVKICILLILHVIYLFIYYLPHPPKFLKRSKSWINWGETERTVLVAPPLFYSRRTYKIETMRSFVIQIVLAHEEKLKISVLVSIMSVSPDRLDERKWISPWHSLQVKTITQIRIDRWKKENNKTSSLITQSKDETTRWTIASLFSCLNSMEIRLYKYISVRDCFYQTNVIGLQRNPYGNSITRFGSSLNSLSVFSHLIIWIHFCLLSRLMFVN